MPGTVQELASMFRNAIDSAGNVLDMGVVKEVVTALERCPVSANDLKSTRLGKYVNQVRRNIQDKSLAKRMKNLVIQWRNVAQQSPTTPNGVPAAQQHTTTPPPPPPPSLLPTSTPSLTSPSAHTPTPPRKLTPPLPSQPPSTQALPDKQASLSSTSAPSPQPPPLTTVPRPTPSSSTPAMNRKRALHRLSKCPPQSQWLSPSSFSSSSSSSSASQHATSASTTSHAPPAPHLTLTPVIKPRLLPEGNGEEVVLPEALHVRLPLLSVNTFIVKIPLSRVSVASSSVKPERLRTASKGKLPVTNSTEIPTTSNNNLPTASESTASSASGTTAPPNPPDTLEPDQTAPLHTSLSDSLRRSEPSTLVVSIDTGLLGQGPEHATGNGSLASPRSTSQATANTDNAVDSSYKTPHTQTDLNAKSSPDVQQLVAPKEEHSEQSHVVSTACSPMRGSVSADGVWRRWTDPIVHKDSFTVNVLPYVYVDGLEEFEDDDSL